MKKSILSYVLFTILINMNFPARAQATEESPPIVCTAPTGLSATAITKSSATIKWLPVSRTNSYAVQYKLSSVLKWTTAAKATTSTSVNIAGLATATLYDWRVRSNCPGGTSTYTQSQFTTGDLYCTSSGRTTYEYINKVALGSINKTSGNNNGYGDFTALSTSLTAGTSYTITLTPGFTGVFYREYWTVFIDYSHDGTLNNSGEIVTTANSTGAVSRTFTVPATAKNGSTRMRIVMNYGSPRSNPCGSYSSGEVEDYTVNISGGIGLTAATAITSDKAMGHNKAISMSNAPNPGVAPVAPLRLSVAPSPAKDMLNIFTTGLQRNKPITLSVISVSGVVQKTMYTTSNQIKQMDVSSLRSGVYFLRVLSGDKILYARFVKL